MKKQKHPIGYATLIALALQAGEHQQLENFLTRAGIGPVGGLTARLETLDNALYSMDGREPRGKWAKYIRHAMTCEGCCDYMRAMVMKWSRTPAKPRGKPLFFQFLDEVEAGTIKPGPFIPKPPGGRPETPFEWAERNRVLIHGVQAGKTAATIEQIQGRINNQNAEIVMLERQLAAARGEAAKWKQKAEYNRTQWETTIAQLNDMTKDRDFAHSNHRATLAQIGNALDLPPGKRTLEGILERMQTPPTPWAYDAACKALQSWTDRAKSAESDLSEIKRALRIPAIANLGGILNAIKILQSVLEVRHVDPSEQLAKVGLALGMRVDEITVDSVLEKIKGESAIELAGAALRKLLKDDNLAGAVTLDAVKFALNEC